MSFAYDSLSEHPVARAAKDTLRPSAPQEHQDRFLRWPRNEAGAGSGLATTERQPEIFWVEDVAPEAYRANYPPPLISLPPVDPDAIDHGSVLDWDDPDDPLYVEVDKLVELIAFRVDDEAAYIGYRHGRLLVWASLDDRNRIAKLLGQLRSMQAATLAQDKQQPRAPQPRRGRR